MTCMPGEFNANWHGNHTAIYNIHVYTKIGPILWVVKRIIGKLALFYGQRSVRIIGMFIHLLTQLHQFLESHPTMQT